MKRVVVTGSTGFLGKRLCYYIKSKFPECFIIALGRQVIQVTDGVESISLDLMTITESELEQLIIESWKPDLIFQLAAKTLYSPPESEHADYMKLNYEIPIMINSLAQKHGICTVYTSTDMVFDGTNAPYKFDSLTLPSSIYGQSKAKSEQTLIESGNCWVIRVPMLYGSGGPFFEMMRNKLTLSDHHQKLNLFDDEFRTCTLAMDVIRMMVDVVLKKGARNQVWNCAAEERISRFQLGLALAEALSADPSLISPCASSSVKSTIPRPPDLSLDSTETYKLIGWKPNDLKSGITIAISESF